MDKPSSEIKRIERGIKTRRNNKTCVSKRIENTHTYKHTNT